MPTSTQLAHHHSCPPSLRFTFQTYATCLQMFNNPSTSKFVDHENRDFHNLMTTHMVGLFGDQVRQEVRRSTA